MLLGEIQPHTLENDKIPKSKEEVESELVRCAGTQFDPKIVEVFTRIEIFDPHTVSWKDQANATESRTEALGLTA